MNEQQNAKNIGTVASISITLHELDGKQYLRAKVKIPKEGMETFDDESSMRIAAIETKDFESSILVECKELFIKASHIIPTA